MIDPSGIFVPDPTYLTGSVVETSGGFMLSGDYGWLEARAYAWCQAPMLTREAEILTFIMMLNLKAGICYDWPWMPDESKEQVHEWTEELKQLEADHVPHSMALAIIKKKMTARRL